MEYDFQVQLQGRRPITERDIEGIRGSIIENGDGFTNVEAIIPNETRIVHAIVKQQNALDKVVVVFEETIPAFLARHEFIGLKNPPNNNLPVFRRI